MRVGGLRSLPRGDGSGEDGPLGLLCWEFKSRVALLGSCSGIGDGGERHLKDSFICAINHFNCLSWITVIAAVRRAGVGVIRAIEKRWMVIIINAGHKKEIGMRRRPVFFYALLFNGLVVLLPGLSHSELLWYGPTSALEDTHPFILHSAHCGQLCPAETSAVRTERFVDSRDRNTSSFGGVNLKSVAASQG